MDMNTQPTGN